MPKAIEVLNNGKQSAEAGISPKWQKQHSQAMSAIDTKLVERHFGKEKLTEKFGILINKNYKHMILM